MKNKKISHCWLKNVIILNIIHNIFNRRDTEHRAEALVAFKKYMPPPLPYFKVNICPFPLPHFGSIFCAYL